MIRCPSLAGSSDGFRSCDDCRRASSESVRARNTFVRHRLSKFPAPVPQPRDYGLAGLACSFSFLLSSSSFLLSAVKRIIFSLVLLFAVSDFLPAQTAPDAPELTKL